MLGKMTVLLIICCCSLPVQGKYGGGTGEPNDPYLIYDANQMNAVGADQNDWDKHFKLMADIDLGAYTGDEFNLIGDYPSNPFTGVFDGNDHTISNFTYDSNNTDNIGVFVYIDDLNAEIKNLGLIDPNVDAGTMSDVASLVGHVSNGMINNCFVEGGGVAGGWDVGGLVGTISDGIITNCYSTGSIKGSGRLGGLVGNNWESTITNCYSTVSISGGGGEVGGLVGKNSKGTITSCYSTGTISAYTAVGGLVGHNDNDAAIINSYSRCAVSGTDRVGGLVGLNSGIITGSCSATSVEGDGSALGGLAGENYSGTIMDCYSTGSVSGETGSVIGGLVGRNVGAIEDCYSTGSVSGASYAGGLVGTNYGGRVDASFWDVNASGQLVSDGGTGKTTTEMREQSTFTNGGWDFVGETLDGPSDIWAMPATGGYPVLWWQLDPLPPLPTFSGGSGTTGDPYVITNADDISRIGHNPRLMDKYFVMAEDINLPQDSFCIIGRGTYRFTGVFDGDYHKIRDFICTTSMAGASIGLFGAVGMGGQIKNLEIENVDVNAVDTQGVGGLVGNNVGGSITNCRAAGWVEGGDCVGGLVGFNVKGIVTNCYWTGNVSGRQLVAGLVGFSSFSSITNSYTSGSVIGDSYVGGLAGGSLGYINNCYSTGEVAGLGRVGGLVGDNGGTVSKSYSTGSVSGYSEVGGLVGYNSYGTVSNSFWDINTSGQTASAGGTGLPIAEMQMQVTFMDAGWDFVGERINGREDIWMMTCEGMSYPKLNWWQPVLGDFLCPDGVDFIDFSFFAGHWHEDNCGASNDCDGRDLNQLGSVDIKDLRIFVDNWLKGF